MTTPPSPLAFFDTLERMPDAEIHERLNHPALQADYQKACEFLASYRGSAATFNAYRRELERFFQWCQRIVHKELRAITRHDFENFIVFCQQPPIHWIGLKKSPRFIDEAGKRCPNPDWRPFVVLLTKVDVRNGQ
jgi:hypothetical protein